MQIRRKCPWCGGLFYLDSGIALCPHCRRPVKAEGKATHEMLRLAFAEALAKKSAFWAKEWATWSEEFGADALDKLADMARSIGDHDDDYSQ